MDSQLVEIIGRSRLVEQLIMGGVEVALPVRDHGIDLIAYLDIGLDLKSFAACPIQMKAATGRAFSITAKYVKFPNLLHAYVWNIVASDGTEIYALTQSEAVAVAETMGYTRSPSWMNGGYYASNKPSARLVGLLEAYRMSPSSWRTKVVDALLARS